MMIVSVTNAMNKQHLLLALILVSFNFLCSCNPMDGFVESNFLLANDSRLPIWLKIPEGYTRDDVTVSVFLYSSNKARFVVRGPKPERTELINIVTNAEWHEVTKEVIKRQGNYNFSPQYYSVTYQNVKDIVSFPCKGAIFWMVNDVEKKYSTNQPECPPINTDDIGRP
ncbi:MAG: hypothetical protein PHZ02_05040 [Desulfocapsaceae bacterium]|nr:hypothetical protein [Desulfocapsaceae bacterium]